jgi:hypothetical protein
VNNSAFVVTATSKPFKAQGKAKFGFFARIGHHDTTDDEHGEKLLVKFWMEDYDILNMVKRGDTYLIYKPAISYFVQPKHERRAD